MAGYRRYPSRKEIIPIPETIEYIPDLNTTQIIKYITGPDNIATDVQVQMHPIESGGLIGPVVEKTYYYNNTQTNQSITVTKTPDITEYIMFLKVIKYTTSVALALDTFQITQDTNIEIGTQQGFIFFRATAPSQLVLQNSALKIVMMFGK